MPESEAWLDDNWQLGMKATGTTTTQRQNLPLDKHGGVDWAKLREWQLRSYPTADLEAELKRRGEA